MLIEASIPLRVRADECKISVVICTYNRAGLLKAALRSVCKQTLDTAKYEVIVVNNNSQDNTRSVVEEFSKRFSNLQYYMEPRQGLSHARNRGWQGTQGKYVAYFDDDCKIPERWIAVAIEITAKSSRTFWRNIHRPLWHARPLVMSA